MSKQNALDMRFGRQGGRVVPWRKPAIVDPPPDQDKGDEKRGQEPPPEQLELWP